MEIMRSVCTILLTISILVSCKTKKDKINIERPFDDIHAKVIEVRKDIDKLAKSIGIIDDIYEVIYINYAFSNYNPVPNIPPREKECDLFERQYGYDILSKRLRTSSDWTSALMLNSQGVYVKRGNSTFISDPVYDSVEYKKNVQLIDLARTNDYITYIRIFNCSPNKIIGYGRGFVDVYEYRDGKFTLLYSKK